MAERIGPHPLTGFLGEAIKAEGDPVGRVGRLQKEALEKHDSNRVSKALGINLLGSYAVFPDSTFEAIGQVYGVNGSRVGQIIRKTVLDIWENSPTEIKRKYPLLELIDFRGWKLKERSLRIRELVAKGKSPEEIKEEMGMTTKELGSERETLGRHGVEVGYLIHKNRKLAEKIKESKSDLETQRLLDSVDTKIRTGFWYMGNDALTSVAKVCREAGMHVRNPDIAELVSVLETAEIPLGRIKRQVKSGKNAGIVQHYYFIATKDKERAKRVLLNEPYFDEFRRNPVTIACGPVTEFRPTLWECRKKRGVQSVGSVLGKLGIYFAGRGGSATWENLVNPGCPVTIFKYHGGFVLREEDIPEFGKHIKRRMAQLHRVS